MSTASAGKPAPMIALVGPVYPYRGGIAHHTAGLAKALGERGHRVEVINFRSLYLRLFFPGKTMYDESADQLSAPQRPMLRPLAPWTWMSAGRHLARIGAQAVVVQWWHVFFAPCLLTVIRLCRRRGVPVTVVCHNVKDHDKHGWLNRIANGMLARSGATIVIMSERDSARFRERFPQTHVVTSTLPTFDFFTGTRLGREEARQRLGLPEDGPLCLFFGLIRPYKGLPDLIDAIGRLKGPRLLVVGEFYEPVERTREQIERLGLGDRVTLIDRYVPNEEVGLYFSAADLLVAPYRTASQSAVVRIATSFALPAIVTDAGGLPEMIEPERTGLVVPASSPEALAGAIDRFFGDGLGESFAPHLEEARRRFSWDDLCGHVEQSLGRGESRGAAIGATA